MKRKLRKILKERNCVRSLLGFFFFCFFIVTPKKNVKFTQFYFGLKVKRSL